MKNYLLAFLGSILFFIAVFADWNTATSVKVILGTFGGVAFITGIFSDWKLSPQYPPVYMARYVDGVPPRRTQVRVEK